MAGKPKGATNADPETIQDALSAWIRLGSSKAAAKELKVSASTLRTWKERNPQLWDSLRQAHASELKSEHAENVKAAWRDWNELRLIAMERIRSGNLDERGFLALSRVVGEYATRGDTVARLDAGDPTSITETRTRAELLDEAAQHAARLREYGIDITAPNVSTTGERH